MRQTIYIILPVHNRCRVTSEFIHCLSVQTYDAYHLVLVDDGSTDGTGEMVSSLVSPSQLTILKGSGKWWWSGSLQEGLNWLKCRAPADNDVILFINDDVTFDPTFLQTGLDALGQAPGTLLLARFRDPTDNSIHETGVDADFANLRFPPAMVPEQINCLSTRGLFAHWADICHIGNFRRHLLPHYLSDYEYTIRAHRKGLKLITSESVALVPKPEQTGLRQIPALNLRETLKMLLSKKFVDNPIYWTSFLLLTCPLRYLPIHLGRLWYSAARLVAAAAFRNQRRQA